MSDLKPTPGPWVVAGENAIEPDVMWGECFVAQCFGFSDGGEALDNARLIAEAGTVFHNTGLSPVQLVEMVKELKEALKQISEIEDQMYGADWEEIEEAREIANAALAKALPNAAAKEDGK